MVSCILNHLEAVVAFSTCTLTIFCILKLKYLPSHSKIRFVLKVAHIICVPVARKIIWEDTKPNIFLYLVIVSDTCNRYIR